MTGPDWYRWYPTKWASGVVGLTPEQRGVYMDVINIILDRGECPADLDYLVRACNCQRRRLKRILGELEAAGKITKFGPNYEQTRAKLERNNAETFTKLQRNRVSKRWENKDLADTITTTTTTTEQQQRDSESRSNSESFLGEARASPQERKNPATLESAAREDSASPGSGPDLAGSLKAHRQDRDKGKKQTTNGQLPDWEWVLKTAEKLGEKDNPPLWTNSEGVQEFHPTEQFPTLEAIYHDHIRWMIVTADDEIGENAGSLARKLIDLYGPHQADEIMAKATEAKNPRAYVVTAIKNAKAKAARS
jgi:hypothetical protein